jgi:hypothetical protein
MVIDLIAHFGLLIKSRGSLYGSGSGDIHASPTNLDEVASGSEAVGDVAADLA